MTMNEENRKKFCATLDYNLIKDLDELKRTTRISKSRLLDEALEDLIEKYNHKKELYKK